MPRWYLRRDGERRPRDGYLNDIKLPVPWWVDPFWFIMGSEPEKRVLAELVRRGIYFQHIKQGNNLGGAVDPTWEADFLFPQFRIWLEVNGVYFHTKTGQIESDALRYAKIAAQGWRVLVWWDYDILSRLQDLMDAVPEFHTVVAADQHPKETTANLPFYTGGLEIDHLAGLRKALSKRTRNPQYEMRYRKYYERRPK